MGIISILKSIMRALAKFGKRGRSSELLVPVAHLKFGGSEKKTMYKFSSQSSKILQSCDRRIQLIMSEVIKRFDCSIICGFRTAIEQDIAYHSGFSEKKYPDSKHNTFPALAVDVIPYPSRYSQKLPFYFMAGCIWAVAHSLKVNIRWGGNWDSDSDFYDQKSFDLAHFEIADIGKGHYVTELGTSAAHEKKP